jgi:hypothetical protein
MSNRGASSIPPGDPRLHLNLDELERKARGGR